MKKLTISLIALIALCLTVLPIYGLDYHPSISKHEVTVREDTEGEIRKPDGTSAGKLELIPGNDDRNDIRTRKDPAVIVTPLEKLENNIRELHDKNPDLTIGRMANELTKNGVTYHDAIATIFIDLAVETAKNTKQFIEDFGQKATQAVEEAVKKEGGKIDDYKPLTLFDVTANDLAKAELKSSDGTAVIPVEMPGVTKRSKIIPLHFRGSLDDMNKIDEKSYSKLTDKEIKNCLKGYDIEVLKYTITEDNIIHLEMKDFSPVMILIKDETDEASDDESSAEDTSAADEEVTEEKEPPSTSSQTHVMLIAGVGLVALFGAVVIGRKASQMN